MNKYATIGMTGLLALASCQKETATNPAIMPTPQPELIKAVHVFNNTEAGYARLELDPEQLNGGAMKRNGNAHTHGNFESVLPPGFYRGDMVRFSGTRNNNGVFGSATIERTWGDNGEYAFTIPLTAECIEINGTDAVYAGVVNGPLSGDVPDNFGLPEGARMWIKVRDNGTGNGPEDQVAPGIMFNSSGMLPCSTFGLNSVVWNFMGPMIDVANASDNIVVH